MASIHEELAKALVAMGDKSKFTDAVLAKKFREIAKIQGKNKATIALSDLMEAVDAVAASDGKIFSITITAANDLLIERTESKKEIPLEQKQRRQRHEKSQQLFTNSDVKNSGSQKGTKKRTDKNSPKRTVRESLNIYDSYSEE